MDRTTSSKAFLDIYDYFRYKTPPTDGQMDRWYDKIKFIPSEAMPWITERITDQSTLSRNLPKEIIKQWHAYRKEHPEKVVFDNTDCDECYDSTGLIHFSRMDIRYNPTVKIYAVALCEKCENYRSQFGSHLIDGGVTQSGIRIPPGLRATRQTILENGWELVNDHRERRSEHEFF